MTYLGTDAGRIYPVHVGNDEPSSAANWRRCPQCDGSGKKAVTADDGSQSLEYCPACGGVGGWYETPKDQVIG